ncbi:MAG: SDR family NAD(P)-dependent oxidoreductase [Terasakiella sp.]|uniref:SDR family NAD(P)-dependent oxidoreductase n=1 Tax=unclassified Terasakiella TaxID=2614952 RepID=UPI003B01005D
MKNDPIAIIGLGCRFPHGANSPRQFWELICNKYDAITEVPKDRWNLDHFYNDDMSEPGTIRTRCAGFIDDFDKFDAAFFGISPREANAMDPQQRQLLQVTWEMFEDAGEIPTHLKGSSTGVYVGCFAVDYNLLSHDTMQRDLLGAHTSIGSSATLLSNRISHYYDFKGPSLSVDTACSSSMVALHLACTALKNGEITRAVVGGVNMIFKPEWTISTSKGGFLSPDGRCKVFDDSANGYVRSEGIGAVLLKPLSQALADNNRIYAVIHATGSNQDGHTKSVTVPSRQSQSELMRAVYQQAQIDPKQVGYVEAHGTGTPTGDPIETGAISDVFAKDRQKNAPCKIGSVKSNIGHLEAASGMAGLIKAALSLHFEKIPPNIHFNTPNKNIPFEDWNLRVVTENTPFKQDKHPRYIGVNSFGFGGTNVHVALEGADHYQTQPHTTENSTHPAHLIALSARNDQALKATVRSLMDYLDQKDVGLCDIATNLARLRQHHDFRAGFVAKDRFDLKEKLDLYLEQDGEPTSVATNTGKIAFVFSGMGPQWWAMGRQLMEEEPLFAHKIKEIDQLLSHHADWSLWEELNRAEDNSRIEETQIAQPGIFALQVALAELLKSKGVTPDAIVGHSAGEVAAAHVSGALSLEDACLVIYHRSRLQHQTEGQGRILATALSQEDTAFYLKGRESEVSLGAVNSPFATALAGGEIALNDIVSELKNNNIFCKMINGKVPYHSPKMDPLKDELVSALQSLTPQVTHTPLFSTVSGTLRDGRTINAEYWFDNIRKPVLFADAIQSLNDFGCNAFVELAPHPVLATSISETLPDCFVVSCLRRKQDEVESVMNVLARLYERGIFKDWHTLYPNKPRSFDLPLYPWQSERYWLESEQSENYRKGGMRTKHFNAQTVHPLLGSRLPSASPLWDMDIDLKTHTYLQDHKVGTDIVYPGAVYLEMALAASPTTDFPVQIDDVSFKKALYLNKDEATPIQFSYTPKTGQFNIHSQIAGQWQNHANGYVSKDAFCPDIAPIDLQDWRAQTTKIIGRDDLYQSFQHRGLTYGPAFQAIEKLYLSPSRALAEMVLPDGLDNADYHLHPSLLDGAFQTFLSLLDENGLDGLYLPVHLDHLILTGKIPHRLFACTELVLFDNRFVKGNITLCDEQGLILAHLSGFTCQALSAFKEDPLQHFEHDFYNFKWEEMSLPANLPNHLQTQNWLICGTHDFAHTIQAGLVEKGAHALLLDGDHLPDFTSEKWGVIFCGKDKEELELLRILQTLGSQQKIPQHICLVTQGYRQGDLSSAGIWGMGRVITNEYPNITCLQIDLQDQNDIPTLLDVLKKDTFGPEIALTNKAIFAKRLHRLDPRNLQEKQHQTVKNDIEVDKAVQHILKQVPPLQKGDWVILHDQNALTPRLCQQLQKSGAQVIVIAYGTMVVEQADLILPAADTNLEYRIMEITGGNGVDLMIYTTPANDYQRQINLVRPSGRFIDLMCMPSTYFDKIRERSLTYIPVNPSHFTTQSDIKLTRFKKDAAYLITGGVRGFGLSVAKWMAANGAGHLILLGRSQTIPDTSKTDIETLRNQGITAEIKACDVTDLTALRDIITPYKKGTDIPLAGIIHAANIYADGYLNQLTPVDFEKVFQTKAIGAKNLHDCTQDIDLDLFVLFSSISAVIGNPGQANYVAGNNYLRRLSHKRHDLGLNSLCINWGAIADVGYLAQNEAVEDQLKQTGISPIDPTAALNAMGTLLDKDICEITLADIDWARWAGKIPPRTALLYEHVLPIKSATEGHEDKTQSSLLKTLMEATTDNRQTVLQDQLTKQVGTILGLAKSKWPSLQQGFTDLGMDSMLSVEFRNRLQKTYDCTLPATLVFLYPTIEKLADYLLNDLLADRFCDEMVIDDNAQSLEELADLLEQTLAS